MATPDPLGCLIKTSTMLDACTADDDVQALAAALPALLGGRHPFMTLLRLGLAQLALRNKMPQSVLDWLNAHHKRVRKGGAPPTRSTASHALETVPEPVLSHACSFLGHRGLQQSQRTSRALCVAARAHSGHMVTSVRSLRLLHVHLRRRGAPARPVFLPFKNALSLGVSGSLIGVPVMSPALSVLARLQHLQQVNVANADVFAMLPRLPHLTSLRVTWSPGATAAELQAVVPTPSQLVHLSGRFTVADADEPWWRGLAQLKHLRLDAILRLGNVRRDWLLGCCPALQKLEVAGGIRVESICAAVQTATQPLDLHCISYPPRAPPPAFHDARLPLKRLTFDVMSYEAVGWLGAVTVEEVRVLRWSRRLVPIWQYAVGLEAAVTAALGAKASRVHLHNVDEALHLRTDLNAFATRQGDASAPARGPRGKLAALFLHVRDNIVGVRRCCAWGSGAARLTLRGR